MNYYEVSDDEETSPVSHGPIIKFSYLYPSTPAKQNYNKNRSSHSSEEGKSVSRQSSSDAESHHYYNVDALREDQRQSWSPPVYDIPAKSKVNVQGITYRKTYNDVVQNEFSHSPTKTNFSAIRRQHNGFRPHIKGWKYSDKPIMFAERTYEERQEEKRREQELQQYRENGFKEAHLYYINPGVTCSTSPTYSVQRACKQEQSNNLHRQEQRYPSSSPLRNPQKTNNFENSKVTRNNEDYEYVNTKCEHETHQGNSSVKDVIDGSRPNSEIDITRGIVFEKVSPTSKAIRRQEAYNSQTSLKRRRISPSPTNHLRSRKQLSPPSHEKQRISPVEFNARRSRFEQYTDSLGNPNDGHNSPAGNVNGTILKESSGSMTSNSVITSMSKENTFNTSVSRRVDDYRKPSPSYTTNSSKTKTSAFSPVHSSVNTTVYNSQIITSSHRQRNLSQEELVKTANQQYQDYLKNYSAKLGHNQVKESYRNASITSDERSLRSPILRGNLSPVQREAALKRSSSFEEPCYSNPKYGGSVSNLVHKYEQLEENERVSWSEYLQQFRSRRNKMKKSRFSSEQRLYYPETSFIPLSRSGNNDAPTNEITHHARSSSHDSHKHTIMRAVSPALSIIAPTAVTSSGFVSPTCIQSLGTDNKCSSQRHEVFSSPVGGNQHECMEISNAYYSSQVNTSQNSSLYQSDSDQRWNNVMSHSAQYPIENLANERNEQLTNARSPFQDLKSDSYVNQHQIKKQQLTQNQTTSISTSTSTSKSLLQTNNRADNYSPFAVVYDKSSERKSHLNMKVNEPVVRARSQSIETHRQSVPSKSAHYFSDGGRRLRVTSPPPPDHFVKLTNEARVKSQSYDINPDQRILNLLFSKGQNIEEKNYDSGIRQKQEVVQKSKFIREIPSVPISRSEKSVREQTVHFKIDETENTNFDSAIREPIYSSSSTSFKNAGFVSTSPPSMRFPESAKSYKRENVISPVNFEPSKTYKSSASVQQTTHNVIKPLTDTTNSLRLDSRYNNKGQNLETSQSKPLRPLSCEDGFEFRRNNAMIRSRDRKISTQTNEEFTVTGVKSENTDCSQIDPPTYVARAYYVSSSQLPANEIHTSDLQASEYHTRIDSSSPSYSNTTSKASMYREFSCLSPQNFSRSSIETALNSDKASAFQDNENQASYSNKTIHRDSNTVLSSYSSSGILEDIPGYRAVNFESKLYRSPMRSPVQMITRPRSADAEPSGYSRSETSSSGNTVINIQTFPYKACGTKDSRPSVSRFSTIGSTGLNDIEQRKRQYFRSVERTNYFPLRSEIISPPPSYSGQQKEYSRLI